MKAFDKFLMMKSFLKIHKLHVYELLKLVLRSKAGLHPETFLNELFVFDKPSFMIRRSTFNLMKIPNFKRKFQRNSISYRGAKLFDILRQNSLFPKFFDDQVSNSDTQRIAHEISDLFMQ